MKIAVIGGGGAMARTTIREGLLRIAKGGY